MIAQAPCSTFTIRNPKAIARSAEISKTHRVFLAMSAETSCLEYPNASRNQRDKDHCGNRLTGNRQAWGKLIGVDDDLQG